MSNAELTILVVLSHGERYGRSILEQAGKLKAVQRIAPGGLYTALGRMEEKGLVSARWADESQPGTGARRRYYRLTAAGKRVLTDTRLVLQQAAKS